MRPALMGGAAFRVLLRAGDRAPEPKAGDLVDVGPLR